VGDSVTLTIAVAQTNGAPAAGVTCTVQVQSQPGTDAAIESAVVTTGANGEATTTLHVGSTPGAIEISAQCGDESVGVITLNVGGVNPPASLPDAGFGAADANARSIGLLPAIFLAASGLLVASSAFVRMRRERQLPALAFVPSMQKLF
jgi:hypothetical protein